ncbi:MAG: hypothetical protein KKD76_06270 [Verrucomicrobia bacterium]|nr:hypothetical protein [Verrucomicrobiota bacterium]
MCGGHATNSRGVYQELCPVTRGSERMSNLWLILVPVILVVALILFFRLTKKS